jgi:DNA-binding transcriptional MerR regulator
MLIGELAKASGTTKDTIRYYDQLGLLITAECRADSRTHKEFSEDNFTPS